MITAQARALAIRPLTVEELPLCEPYGRAFHQEKGIPGEFAIEVFVRKWTALLTQYHGILLGLWDDERVVGGLGGLVVPDMTTDIMTATELFLYIDPAYRKGSGFIRLVDRFKEYGRSRGAVRFRLALMLLPGDEIFPLPVEGDAMSLAQKLDQIYRKRWGVKPVEVGYDGPID